MAVWGRIILKGVILYMRKYGSQDCDSNKHSKKMLNNENHSWNDQESSQNYRQYIF